METNIIFFILAIQKFNNKVYLVIEAFCKQRLYGKRQHELKDNIYKTYNFKLKVLIIF